MDRNKLQKSVRELATLNKTEAPVISCYLDLEQGVGRARAEFGQRLADHLNSLTPRLHYPVDEAAQRIQEYLRIGDLARAKSAAMFSRGGEELYFTSMRFGAPLPNHVSIDSMPSIYHLVELKDTYESFVILLATSTSARILEVNLGAVTEELWHNRPELRKRVGREWTKAHYQAHRDAQTDRFIREKIRILEELISKRGHHHLILAGDPRMTARVRDSLPKHLTERLVDIVPASSNDKISDVVKATLSSFVEYEAQDSRAVLDELRVHLHADGLAVAGWEACRQALLDGQGDRLVIGPTVSPSTAWIDPDSDSISSDRHVLAAALGVTSDSLKAIDIREELVRLAAASGCEIEVCEPGELYDIRDQVGCLLRYRTVHKVS